MRSLWRATVGVKQAMGYSRAVASYCRPYRYRLLLLTLLSLVVSVPALLTPTVMQLIIDEAYPARDFRLLGWLCAALLMLKLLPNALTAGSSYLSTYVQNLLEYKLSLRVFSTVQRLPQFYREEHGAGMFLERATRDVRSVSQSMTSLVPQIIATVSTFLLTLPLMLRLDVRITLVVLAVIPLNYLITARLTRKMVALQMAGRTVDEKITTFLSETIEGATITQLFSLIRVRRRKLRQLLREHLHITFAGWRVATTWGQLGRLVTSVWSLVLLCGGWYLVFTDHLQLGQAVALGMYINLLARPFQQVESLYQGVMATSVSARRVLEILNAGPAVGAEADRRLLAGSPREFELRNLSFAYGKNPPCLHHVNLRLRTGRTLAIVGPSGAGKSTLIRILSGLDDRYQGQFLVDGHDFREVNRDSYLRRVSMVPQTVFFFSDSIRENLCAGNCSISIEQLRRCASILGLDGMIDSAPAGYDTKLGAEGIRLSVGQYQKLGALRALLKDASLLLLDEVTSAMDADSERKLVQGIITLRPKDCVTVLVTHHIAITTQPWIDEIVVMINGRIVERGSCDELRAKRGFYQHWVSLSDGSCSDQDVRADCFLGDAR